MGDCERGTLAVTTSEKKSQKNNYSLRYQKISSKRHAQKIHHVTFTNPHSNSKCNLKFSKHWLLEKAVQINFTPPFSVHSTPNTPILPDLPPTPFLYCTCLFFNLLEWPSPN